MIILAIIQRAEKQVMTDKKTGQKSEMFQLVLSDATKPVQFRCTTPFITFAGTDKLMHALGTTDPDTLADMQVTMACAEVGQYNAMLKVKGQLVKGWQTGEALAALNAAPPAAPAPVKPGK